MLKVISSRVRKYIEYNIKNGVNIPFIESISKSAYLARRFVQLYKNCLKVYIPVHVILMILRLIRSKKNKRLSIVIRFFKGLVASALFASLFAMSIPWAYTYLDKVIKNADSSWYGFLVSFSFSWTILFESPSRWGEMSIYVLSNWFEGFTYSIYKRQYAPTIPHWDKCLFAITMGIIAKGYYEVSGKVTGKEESTVSRSDQLKDRRVSDDSDRQTKLEYAFSFILGESFKENK